MIKTCVSCGQLFEPESGESRCADCRSPKTTTIKNIWGDFCEVVEDHGRCKEYVDGKCENCLNYCAKNNWLGWRKKNGCPIIFEMSEKRKMQIWKELFSGEERE